MRHVCVCRQGLAHIKHPTSPAIHECDKFHIVINWSVTFQAELAAEQVDQRILEARARGGREAPLADEELGGSHDDEAYAHAGKHFVILERLDGSAEGFLIGRDLCRAVWKPVETRYAGAQQLIDEEPPAEINLAGPQRGRLEIMRRGEAPVGE